jgi:hypothetical protein
MNNDQKLEKYDVQDPDDVIFVNDVLSKNVPETWKVNKWYQVPFDSLVCVRTKGETIYASASLCGLIYHSNIKTQRGALESSARFSKCLGGEYWENGADSFVFPVLTGEKFMIYKSSWSPMPDWMEIFIQVIPYPRPE